MQRLSCLAVWGIVFIATTAFGQADPKDLAGDPTGSGRVGKFANLSKLPIFGAEQIPQERVRDVLQADLAIQIASGPAATVTDFNVILQRNLLAAYQASGFRDAKVEIRLDAHGNPAAIDITEGPRFNRGAIRVEGARSIDAARLKSYLTSTDVLPFQSTIDADQGTVQIGELSPPEQTRFAAWKEGSPASFRDAARRGLSGQVRSALAGMGYFRTRFSIQLVVVDRLVDLVIQIEDEGPRATLAEVAAPDSIRVDVEELSALLGLRRGMAIDLGELMRVQQALWNSGRYKRHLVQASPHADGGGAVRIRLELEENPRVPGLKESLRPADQAMLKAGRWIEQLEGSGHDLLLQIDAPIGSLDMALSPQRGWAIALRRKSPTTAPADPANRTPIDFGVIAAGQRLHFFSSRTRTQVQTPLPVNRMNANVMLVPSFIAREGRWSKLTIGAGVNYTSDTPAENPLHLALVLSPAVILNGMHQDEIESESGPGYLRLKGDSFTIEIDPESGRLIQLSGNPLPGASVRLVAQRDAFEALHREMSAAAPTSRPATDAESIAAMVDTGIHLMSFMQLWTSAMPSDESVKQVARLAGPGVNSLLAGVVAPRESHSFTIPPEPELLVLAGGMGIFSKLFIRGADRIAPRGSWAWTLARESLLAFEGLGVGTNREMLRLYDDKTTGPLACLIIARSPLARMSPNAPGLFARSGLRKLNVDAAIEDLRFLWDPQSPAADVASQMIRELSRMDVAEVQAIADLLPEDWGTALNVFAGVLRTTPDQPLERAVPNAIKIIWDPYLLKPTESALKAIADAPPSRGTP